MNDRTYDDGVRDGEIAALKEIAANHKDRLDHHSNRLRWLERVIYALVGGLAVIEVAPRVLEFLKATGS